MTDNHDIVTRPESLPVKGVLHPAVERLLERDPTPETLEKILDLQRQWEAAEARRAYTRALVHLREDLPMWIKRDKVVSYSSSKGPVRYTHASLAGSMEAVIPALTQHGFSLGWTPRRTEKGEVEVTATLTHQDGHSESATLSAPVDSSGAKSVAQGVASTVTLLQRYTALSLLGLATADMEEPRGAEEESPPSGDAVDTERNLKAAAWLAKKGWSREQAENFAGRPIGKWTADDLERLREWAEPKRKKKESGGPSTYQGSFPDHGKKSEGGKTRYYVTGEDGEAYSTDDSDVAAYIRDTGFDRRFVLEYDLDGGERQILQVTEAREDK